MRRRWYVVLSLIVAVVLAVVIFAAAHTWYVQRQATGFLAALHAIRVGSSDTASVMRITKPFQSYRSITELSDRTEVQFLFYNEWPVRLKLAKPAEFRAYINLEDGIVVEKYAREAAWELGCVGSIREVKRGLHRPEGKAPENYPNHIVYWEEYSPRIAPHKVRRIRIEDDDTYPGPQLQKDWAFDLSCLTELGSGCRDARTMLPNAAPTPSVWEDAGQKTKQITENPLTQ